MKLRRIVSIASSSVLLALPLRAHGGFSPGPPAVPPPPEVSSGGSSGGSKGSSPSRPPAPMSPGPAAPGAPAGASASPAPLTGGTLEPDLTDWGLWWDLNKAAYLELKAHVHSPGAVSGIEGWYLGENERTRAGSLQPSAQQVREQVVPALLAVLEREQDHDLVSGAMVALAKIGHDESSAESRRFEAALGRFLVDPNQEIRETAAVSLGILASPRAISTLANLLWDTDSGRALVKRHEVDYRTRAFAAYGLGLIGARTASDNDRALILAALRRAFERDETSTPDLAVACLVAFSIVPLATLEPRAARALGEKAEDPPESSRQAQLEYLLAVLRDRRREVRVRAQCPIALARLLAGLPPERSEAFRAYVAGELIARLEPKRELPELVQSCVLALGAIGSADAAPLDGRIRAALENAFQQASETQARGFALIALAQVGGRRGPGDWAAGSVQAAEFLLRQMIDGKGTLRPWAALACGVLGHALLRSDPAAPLADRLRRGVRSVLADERDPSRLGACAIAAGLLRDRESAPLLLERLAKALPDEARGRVATGLGLLGYHEALPLLRQLVGESTYRPLLLRECAIALGVLGDKEAAPLLVGLLQEARSMATQTTISTALGFIGDQRSIEPLLLRLGDRERSERSRGYAAVALGNVADKERLPWNANFALGLNYRASTSTLTDPLRGGGILDIF